MEHVRRQNIIPYAILIALIIAYLLPWVTNRPSGLVLGAYDLAEWASLHPAAYATIPTLLPSLLLRIHLTYIVLLGITYLPMHLAIPWLISLCIAQAPPLEFFSQLSNVNYQQQIALAVISALVGVFLLLSPRKSVVYRWVRLFIALTGVLGVVWGYQLAYQLIEPFKLDTHIGFGPIFISLLYVGILAKSIINTQGSAN